MQLSPHRQKTPPVVRNGEIVIERPELFLSIAATGEFLLQRVDTAEAALDAPERPTRPVSGPSRAGDHPEPLQSIPRAPGATSGDMTQPLPTPLTPVEGSGQERVALSGRVGANPTFRLTDRNALIAKFPLAVKQTD